MKKIKIIAILASLTLGLSARAGILIEPYMTYESSTQDIVSKIGSIDVGGKTTGLGLGARLGYTLPVLFWFALDYSLMSDGTFSPSQSSSTADKVDRSDLYLTAGFDFPIMFRAWFGYGLMNKATVKDSSGNAELSGGTNIKLGGSFTGLPIVCINLEYFQNDFGNYKASGVDGSASDTFSTSKESGFRLGVSAPFDL